MARNVQDSLQHSSAVAPTARPMRCEFCGGKALGYYYGVASCESCGFSTEETSQLKPKPQRLAVDTALYSNFHRGDLSSDNMEIQDEAKTRLPRYSKASNRANRKVPSSIQLPHNILEAILSAEASFDLIPISPEFVNSSNHPPLNIILHSANDQLIRLLNWAYRLPYFNSIYLSEADQVSLLSSSWIKWLLVSAAFNSTTTGDGLVLSSGHYLSRSQFGQNDLGRLVNQFYKQLVVPLRALHLDTSHRAFLRTMVFFDSSPSDMINHRYFNWIRGNLHSEVYRYLTTKEQSEAHLKKVVHLLCPLRLIAYDCLQYLKSLKLSSTELNVQNLTHLVVNGTWSLEHFKFYSMRTSSE